MCPLKFQCWNVNQLVCALKFHNLNMGLLMCTGLKYLPLFLLIGMENMTTVLKLERNALLIGQNQVLLRVQEEEIEDEGGENSTVENSDMLIA